MHNITQSAPEFGLRLIAIVLYSVTSKTLKRWFDSYLLNDESRSIPTSRPFPSKSLQGQWVHVCIHIDLHLYKSSGLLRALWGLVLHYSVLTPLNNAETKWWIKAKWLNTSAIVTTVGNCMWKCHVLESLRSLKPGLDLLLTPHMYCIHKMAAEPDGSITWANPCVALPT